MQKQRFRIPYLAVVTVVLLGPLSVAAWATAETTLNKQLTETISKVRTGETAVIQIDAAKHLVDLTHGVDPNQVDDKVLDDIASLLDTSDHSVCFNVAAALANLGSRGEVAVRNQLIETMAKVRAGDTKMIRDHAAEHLVDLISAVDPNKVEDKIMDDIVSLLDSPDDYVRIEVALALGDLGPRAKVAVPKLLKVLEETDCLPFMITSAVAIRAALPRIGVTPPLSKCGRP